MTMTLYELTKKYGEGKGESMMWTTLEIVSDKIEESMDDESKEHLMRCLYSKMSDGHYDREYAIQDVSKMYYVDQTGMKHNAPYWTEAQVMEAYQSVKKDLPSYYNEWDFYVTLQMIKSDYCPLLKKWYPTATQDDMDKKLIELAVNWLNDSDNPYGKHKVWGYLSAK